MPKYDSLLFQCHFFTTHVPTNFVSATNAIKDFVENIVCEIVYLSGTEYVADGWGAEHFIIAIEPNDSNASVHSRRALLLDIAL